MEDQNKWSGHTRIWSTFTGFASLCSK